MTEQRKPPRVLGILRVLLGLLLTVGGLWLVARGDLFYFATVGVGLLVSGALLAAGKKAGLVAYGATLAIIIVWSAIETGADVEALVPRLAVPLFIGGYLSQQKVRSTLS